MERDKLVLFLDLLENAKGNWLEAFAAAGAEAFGVERNVRAVLDALHIHDADAEIIFQHLPDDPAVLAAFLRPRMLGSRD